MQYRSIFINLKNKSCFIVGGNKYAAEICASLLEDGALITVWSEEFANELIELSKSYPRQINLLQAKFTPEVAKHYCSAKIKPFIVVTSSSDPAYNQDICDICSQNNVLSFNPSSSQSETLIVDNISADPIELAIVAKGFPELTKNLQKKFEEIMEKTWLSAIRSYTEYSESENVSQLNPAERRIFFRRLSNELVKSEGDFEEALSATSVYYNNLQTKDELLLELADERSLMD